MKHKHPLILAGIATAMTVAIGGAVLAQSAPQKTDRAAAGAENSTVQKPLPSGQQEYAREDYEVSSDTITTLSPAKLEWFRDAKFGMFIHWGLFSVPGGVYEGKPCTFVMDDFKIPAKTYEKLAAQFNPVKFDADAWVKLANDAGMKYLCLTAKHHEGFAMYGSKASPFNIVDATPWKRDPVKELSVACKKYGIKLCLYYSQTLDWHEPDAYGNTWEFGPDEGKDFERYMRAKSIPQIKEILTQYGPIGLIWFDQPAKLTPAQSKVFRDLVHSIQPNCLVDGRVGNGYGDYRSMSDGLIPSHSALGPWETCMTINDHWGYNVNDTNFKSTKTLLHNLVDITSKGGNYLLNVGPTAEGVIPQPEVERLEAIGQWMKVNSEAIYGTQSAAFLFPPWGRVTMKPGRLYLHVFDWPADGKLVLDGLVNPVAKAWLLSDPDRKDLKASVADGVLTVQLPGIAPDPDDSVVVVQFTGGLKVERHPLRQADDGSLVLDIVNSDIGARWFTWNTDVVKPGKYQVAIIYTSRPLSFILRRKDSAVFPIEFGAENGAPVTGELAPASHLNDYLTVSLGTVDLPVAGRTKFKLSTGNKEAFSSFILFKKIELKPVK